MVGVLRKWSHQKVQRNEYCIFSMEESRGTGRTKSESPEQEGRHYARLLPGFTEGGGAHGACLSAKAMMLQTVTIHLECCGYASL